ncbi:hypothetical protein [Streptomyces antimycoticus]|uniref:hypothetical protein n=1 Tax=Streptomyces antimycoticus TaxID=68175 RepID=UPI00353017AA
MEPGPPLGEFSGLGEDVQDAVDSLAQVIRFKERQRAGLQQYAAIVGLSTAQKLSAAALSKQEPVRPVLWRSPNLPVSARD